MYIPIDVLNGGREGGEVAGGVSNGGGQLVQEDRNVSSFTQQPTQVLVTDWQQPYISRCEAAQWGDLQEGSYCTCMYNHVSISTCTLYLRLLLITGGGGGGGGLHTGTGCLSCQWGSLQVMHHDEVRVLTRREGHTYIYPVYKVHVYIQVHALCNVHVQGFILVYTCISL